MEGQAMALGRRHSPQQSSTAYFACSRSRNSIAFAGGTYLSICSFSPRATGRSRRHPMGTAGERMHDRHSTRIKNVGPHNVPERTIEGRNTSRARLDRKAREKLGNGLRAAYNDVREWELPERLRVLLDQLT